MSDFRKKFHDKTYQKWDNRRHFRQQEGKYTTLKRANINVKTNNIVAKNVVKLVFKLQKYILRRKKLNKNKPKKERAQVN